MTKEIKKIETQSTSLAAFADDAWGFDAIDPKDIIIPRLLLLQANGKLVADEKGAAGDILNTTTYEKLGSGRKKDKKDISVIPIKMYKTLLTELKRDGTKSFVSLKPITPGMEIPPYDVEQGDGSVLLNMQCINVYFLLASEATDPTALPHVITFKNSSYNAGKVIANHFLGCLRARAAGFKDERAIPAATVFSLGANGHTNERGQTFFVYEVSKARNASVDELAAAHAWAGLLKGKEVKEASETAQGEDIPF